MLVFIMNTLHLTESAQFFWPALFVLVFGLALVLRLQHLIAYDALLRWGALSDFTLLAAQRVAGVHPAHVAFDITFADENRVLRSARAHCINLYAGCLNQSVILADDEFGAGSPIPGAPQLGRDI
jgi:hypothetical protein